MPANLRGAATSAQLIPDKSVAIQQFKNYRFEGDYNLLSEADAHNPKQKTTTCICSPHDAGSELSRHTNICLEERLCKRCRPLIDWEWQKFNAAKEQREKEDQELRAEYGASIATCSDGPSNRCQCFYKRIDEILVVDDANEHTHRLFFPQPVDDWRSVRKKKGKTFFVPSFDVTMLRLNLAVTPVVEPTMQKFYWQRLAILLGIPIIGAVSARLCSTIDPRMITALYGVCGFGYMVWNFMQMDIPRPSERVVYNEMDNVFNGIKSNYSIAIEQARDALCATKQLTQRQVHYNQMSAAICIDRINNDFTMQQLSNAQRGVIRLIADERLNAETRENHSWLSAFGHAGVLQLLITTGLVVYQS